MTRRCSLRFTWTMILNFSTTVVSARILVPRSFHSRHSAAASTAFQYSKSSNQRRSKFTVTAPYEPSADQPQAIQALVKNFERGDKFAMLRGCTGTGKTMVMAHTIANIGKRTLVLCHNKTLAAQLARELRSFLAKNKVHLFVSHFDHYVPESYSVTTGKYISKKSSVNDELDALRHMATRALVQHEDVVVVASVSCIYGLGMPKSYIDKSFTWLSDGSTHFESLGDIMQALEGNLYDNALSGDDGQSSGDLHRGQYELTSNATFASISLWPPYELFPWRVDLEYISNNGRDDHSGCWIVCQISQGGSAGLVSVGSITCFPAKHYVTDSEEVFQEALRRIEDECAEQSQKLRKEGKIVEADRLQQRVANDLLLLKESGSCPGVENYSRHLSLRGEGDSPDTLLDYFGLGKEGWMLVIDESHVALPQLKAMYAGDRARKKKLVENGYRLPSALDNRPLTFDEFWDRVEQTLFVSATPAPFELSLVDECIDMSIRPTYVPDPIIKVRPTNGQLDDLAREIQLRITREERTLALALTKHDAEDLSGYLMKLGIKSDFIHSGLKTHERSKVLNSLQSGSIDCLVGVNVLREGLDLPQVSLVAILGADVEGFLRSETALLQMIGRSARNVNGEAIFYADKVTDSMQSCIDITASRRKQQLQYNKLHNKEMRSTSGSSMLSIFEILKDDIKMEKSLHILSDAIEDDDVHEKRSQPVVSVKHLSHGQIQTDHIPSKPGIYFWKSVSGDILYIGKAKRLRSRVKSYLSPSAKHTERIKTMLRKAHRVEIILTPTEKDALVLESSLIKLYQPPFNVLLKDDESFPFICASIGDQLPSFSLVPRVVDTPKSSMYKYFGPYPDFKDASAIMQRIEDDYNLRSLSFQCRFGGLDSSEYMDGFNKALKEVFFDPSGPGSRLPASAENAASPLFHHKHNVERDIVTIIPFGNKGEALVHVIQLREGIVTGQYPYTVSIGAGITRDEDLGGLIQIVLEQKHYPLGDIISQPISQKFFPKELLVQYPLPDSRNLRTIFRRQCEETVPSLQHCKALPKLIIRSPTVKGVRAKTDRIAMEFALENAQEVALIKSLDGVKTSIDGTAAKDLAKLLSLEHVPNRIEAYDVSHTKGAVAVGSRVVFENGKPLKKDYRRFNIRSVKGIDDYASIEEVLSRRFKKAWVNGAGPLVGRDNPWKLPCLVVIDGGKGQLNAALAGMKKASIYASNRSDKDEMPKSSRSATVPIVSLAKNMEEVFAPDSSAPLRYSPDSPALILLRSLRDESHRFALSSHRRRRSKLLNK